jgi:hypothetical protein
VNLVKSKFPAHLARWLPAIALATLAAQQANASGTIAYRGLLTGVDSSWIANTSGTSYSTWEGDGTTNFLRVSFNATHDYGLNHVLAERNEEAIYVKVWERQNGGTAHGPKNFKIFGQNTGSESNTTIGLAGYGNTYDIYYGDSSSGNNDATVEWSFSGIPIGGAVFSRAQPAVVTKISTPPTIDNNWHEWGYYVKFNDDNTQNGEVIVLYDGKEIFHLTKVFNRANGAAPIDNFGVGQFYQPIGGSYAMSRDYRDVRVAYDGWPASTDISGNVTSGGTTTPTPPTPPTAATPEPPTQVAVQ